VGLIKGFLLVFNIRETADKRHNLLVTYTRGQFPKRVQSFVDQIIAPCVGNPRVDNVCTLLMELAFMERHLFRSNSASWMIQH
jgi:hypothetical protein